MTFAPWFWRPSSNSKHQFCSRSQFHDVEIKRFRIVADLSCRLQCFTPQTGRLPDLSIFTTRLSLPPPSQATFHSYIALWNPILNITFHIMFNIWTSRQTRDLSFSCFWTLSSGKRLWTLLDIWTDVGLCPHPATPSNLSNHELDKKGHCLYNQCKNISKLCQNCCLPEIHYFDIRKVQPSAGGETN